MLSDAPTLLRRNVWVLMFDELPTDCSVPGGSAAESCEGGESVSPCRFSPFDDLDLTSTFFEQYLIQDVRESARITDVFGGCELLEKLRTRLASAGTAVLNLRLRCMDDGTPDHSERCEESSLFQSFENSSLHQHALKCGHGDAEAISLPGISPDVLHGANLLWLDVQTGCCSQPMVVAESVLAWTRKMHSACVSDPLARPVLIVSSRRGLKREVNAPFKVRGNEGLVHAPLWIDSGAGHACRVQALTGSFDLLPTVEEYLTGFVSVGLEGSAPENSGPHALANLSGDPISLVPLVHSFQSGKDRLLVLTGDSWTALRSLEYLLVHDAKQDVARPEEASGISADAHEAAPRSLYLKPDDYWNVHDVIVAYEAIADEMENLARLV